MTAGKPTRHHVLDPAVHDTDGGRRRLAPEERKAELLSAALEVFGEVGFERATLQQVADRAGVTKGALYHYYASKDELFSELVRDRLVGLVAAGEARVAGADPSLSRRALLQEHLESMWDTLQQPDMLRLTQLILTELPAFPELGGAFFAEVVGPARDTMRRILLREPVGPARSAQELDTLVAVLPSMLMGIAMTQEQARAIEPMPLDMEVIGRVVIRTLLDGLAPEAP